MRAKARNQSKFMRVLTIPIRFLGKARDFYVKSMTDCSMRMSYGQSMALPATQQFPPLPRSFSVDSSRSADSEDYRELVRAASARSLGYTNEIEMYIQQLKQQQSSKLMGSKTVLPKSSSLGMGFMGRIDEDQPCDFEAAGVVVVKPRLYPRSRSYAIGNERVAL